MGLRCTNSHHRLNCLRVCGPWAVQNRWGAQSGKISVSLREIVVFEVPGHLPGCPGRGAEASRDHLLEPGRAREGTGVNFRYEKVVQNGFFDQLRVPKRDEDRGDTRQDFRNAVVEF